MLCKGTGPRLGDPAQVDTHLSWSAKRVVAASVDAPTIATAPAR